MAKEENKTKQKKHFFKDFKAELKKVIWPTPKQIVNNTVAVITIVLITAVIVLVLDLAFEAVNTYGINKLKNVVESSQGANNTTDGNNTQENETNSTENNAEENNTNTTGENNEANSAVENSAQ